MLQYTYYQQLVSKALATIHSKKGAHNFPQILLGLFYCILSTTSVNKVNRQQHLQQRCNKFTETRLCFCNNINSHQHKPTPVNKGFGQQYFQEGTLSLSLLAFKITSTMSTDSNSCIKGATESQKHYLAFVSTSMLSTVVITCQHLSTEALAISSSEKRHYP